MFTRKFVVKLRAGRFCPVQIGCIEAEIHNLKEDLHTKNFLILEKVVSLTVHHLQYVHVVLQ